MRHDARIRVLDPDRCSERRMVEEQGMPVPEPTEAVVDGAGGTSHCPMCGREVDGSWWLWNFRSSGFMREWVEQIRIKRRELSRPIPARGGVIHWTHPRVRTTYMGKGII